MSDSVNRDRSIKADCLKYQLDGISTTHNFTFLPHGGGVWDFIQASTGIVIKGEYHYSLSFNLLQITRHRLGKHLISEENGCLLICAHLNSIVYSGDTIAIMIKRVTRMTDLVDLS